MANVEMFLSKTYGLPDTPETRTISRQFWLDIGRKHIGNREGVNRMLILCGPQGIGKSQSIKILAGTDRSTDLIAKMVRGDEDLSDYKFVEITDFSNLKPKNIERIKALLGNPKNALVTFIGTANTSPDTNNPESRRTQYLDLGPIDLNTLMHDYQHQELPPEYQK